MENKKNREHEHGNILFLVLIAAALFAALSYVVTQSSRSGGDAEREKARLDAAEILNYATALQSSVGRMIIGGCALGTINFENDYDGTLHVNPNAPADRKCNVFDPPGGGVAAKKPEPGWATDSRFYYAGSAALSGVGLTCASSNCAELVLVLRGISQALCKQLNELNGYKTLIADLPTDTQQACPYKGTMDCNGNGNVEVIFSAPELSGKHSYCYNDSVHGLTFVHAILER